MLASTRDTGFRKGARSVFRLLLVVAGLGAVDSGRAAEPRRLVFEETFRSLSLRGPAHPDGRWDTLFQFGGRTLPTNGEMQLYVDADFRGLGLDPFSLGKHGLTITARRVDDALRARLDGQPYASGLLTTEHSFAQTYGYFELRGRMPAGKGLWPAFWLLPEDKTWPPEIDILEVLGDRPDILNMALHSTQAQVHDLGYTVQGIDLSRDFHSYGLLWKPDVIAWFLDGREVARAPTPGDMHKPMYMLINLAVGGHWPGAPDAATRFPAEFQVAWVRAWAIPETIPDLPHRDGARP